MHWRIKNLRHAADLPNEREEALRPLPGTGVVSGAAPRGIAGADVDVKSGAAIHEERLNFGSRHGDGKAPNGFHPELPTAAVSQFSLNGRLNGLEDASKTEKAGKEAAKAVESAQPFAENWVSEGMATLVLDNSKLGSGMGSAAASAGAGWPRRSEGSESSASGTAQRASVVESAVELDPKSDAAIMLRVAAGDEDAFNYLVGKYHRPMIHFLFRMARNQAVAEELAQEVFLRVYRSRESYRAEAKFTTWLYRIATNLAVNHARDTKHERSAQTVYLDAPDEESGTTPDVADDEPSVEQRLLRDERMKAIRAHVMELPERQRMAVLMHKYQGMDYRQIGEVLKLSESATKSLLFRAYQTLRDKLKEFV